MPCYIVLHWARCALHARCARALLLFSPDLVHQILAQIVIGHAEFLPPVGQQFIDFTNVGSQTHEVKGGTEAGLFYQPERRTPHALFETRLHEPDFTHIAG
jgi:hypothetical protein